MSFKVPEIYRISEYSSIEDGHNGIFLITQEHTRMGTLKVIASDGMFWEHVSVSKTHKCPTWEEMCFVKSLFWDEEDTVVQYHPSKSEYVNNHSTCLHLWRPTLQTIVTPPSWMIGIKKP